MIGQDVVYTPTVYPGQGHAPLSMTPDAFLTVTLVAACVGLVLVVYATARYRSTGPARLAAHVLYGTMLWGLGPFAVLGVLTAIR